MAHLGTIHLPLRDHAVIMFSSGCYISQKSQKNWNSEAFRGKRPGLGKDHKQMSEDLDMFSL